MKLHFNKPLISIVSSLFALCLGIVLTFSMRLLPEQQSIQMFFVLMPAVLLLACLGYLAGATTKNSGASTAGFLIGGGLLLTVVVILLLPALYS